MWGAAFLSRARAPLVAGLALVAARFAVEQSRGLFVFGDAFQAYAHFNLALGNLLAAGELAQWLPFTAYGCPNALGNLMFLSPFDLLALMLGWVAGWDNAWVLFNASIVLEMAVLCAGTWLLARELFQTRAAQWAVVLGSVLLPCWEVQIFWSHRMMVYWPLLLFFTLRFHRTGNVADVAKGCLAGLFLLWGNIAYAAPVHAMLVLVVCAAAAVFLRQRGVGLDRASLARPATWGVWTLVAVLAGLYGWLTTRAFDGIRILTPGRNADGTVPLDVFLNYGGSAAEKLPEFFTGFPYPHIETYSYLGLMGVALILLVLWRGRTGMMWVVFSAAAFLLLLSLGPHGFVAQAAYEVFPFANRYRHLNMLLPLVRWLLLLLVGFGVDALDAADGPRRLRNCLFAAIPIMLGGKWLFVHPPSLMNWIGWLPEIGVLLGLAALLLASRTRLASPQRAATAVLLLELALAQGCLLALYPRLTPPQSLRGLHMDPKRAQSLPFPPCRVDSASDDPRWTSLARLASRQPVNYPILLHLVGLDLCAPVFRTDFASESTLRDIPGLAQDIMDRSNSIIPSSARLAGVFWKNVMADPERRKQVGCAGTPKLTLRQGPAETLPEVLHFSANKLKLRAHASGPGAVLRYADSFDPRWRAAIDGRPAPVEDGHPFKLLRLPPGRHEVEFNFHDRTQDWTLRLAGLGAVLALATLLIRETRG